jgi:hypothetical protein
VGLLNVDGLLCPRLSFGLLFFSFYITSLQHEFLGCIDDQHEFDRGYDDSNGRKPNFFERSHIFIGIRASSLRQNNRLTVLIAIYWVKHQVTAPEKSMSLLSRERSSAPGLAGAPMSEEKIACGPQPAVASYHPIAQQQEAPRFVEHLIRISNQMAEN